MADISTITLPSGDTYNFKDATARNSIPSISVTQTLSTGTEIGRIIINGTTIVLYAPSYTNGEGVQY